jgi:hypothetical protein
MSAKELLDMTASISSAVLETQAIRDKLFEEFDAAQNEEHRCSLLAMLKATMDIAEVYVGKSGNATRLAEFKEARADDYARLLVKESSVGGGVSPETLLAITSRESAAGRLTPGDATRLLARSKTQNDFDYTTLMSSALTDTQAIRDKIFTDFEAAQTEEQRCALLADLKGTMDIAEFFVAKAGDAKRLAEFKEARAKDYSRLIFRESADDGTLSGQLSPEMLMAVTNREIQAGRLSPDDPIRQIAVSQAAAPHLSHAEMVAKAKARKASDMSIQSLIDELTAARSVDIVKFRERIEQEFKAAVTSDQRSKVLAIRHATLDQVEQHVAARPNQAEVLKNFREARAHEYKSFIYQECIVGLDTPVVGGDVSVDMLMAVTNREIAAGRMTEDHTIRQAAVKYAAEPHMSHAELVEKHARLKAEAAQTPDRAPKPAPGSSGTAYAFGSVLGKKLKGFFGK